MLWARLVTAGIDARQLPPAQIKAFAVSQGGRAKTGRIDAELIARFMLFRPAAGRRLPGENLRIIRAFPPRRKQGIPADVEAMEMPSRPCWAPKIGDLERRIERVLAQG